MTADISRHSLRPGQKYTGLVHQQGRLPLDADATEAIDLTSLLLQDTVADAICAKGSPGDGFRISPPITATAVDGLDFNISHGTFFLGGKRCVTADTTYQSQPDWLTFALDAAGPALPKAGEKRTDLIWLRAWEQVVTATEDAELLEPGLGGPDTTARRRMICRVEVLENVAGDCPQAFEQKVAEVFPDGQLDSDRCAVESDVRLTIGFTQLEPLDDLCRPSVQAGFLGARNETFRIQVTTPGRFVWGRDNAAPLYRVQVANDEVSGLPRKLVFLTPPRDEFGWPLAGMTVELLRWGALLDNGEKAAEPTGLLLSVENGYDPADESIIVSDDIPVDWVQWFATPQGQAAISPRDAAEENCYFYLRVWTGGGQGNAVDHDMNPGNAVELGETGLTATFSSDGIPGDYWIVSARPNTPTSVTPWALLDGAPPAGPRRLLAPLALLNWQGPSPGAPQDCRNRFRKLCRVHGCCVATVGNGVNSHGDFSSIEEAIKRLPDEGGEVCIHAGKYEEHVVIENRRNITISGCGRNTRWQAESGRDDPLLTIRNSSGIIVRRLSMTATAGEGIVAEDLPANRPQGGPLMENLLLEDLIITVSDYGAVAGLGGSRYILRRCHIKLAKLSAGLNDSDEIGRDAAVFLVGDDLTVENCRIEAPLLKDQLRLPVGGIHIGGGSERVIIRDNVIRGGNGHGITLGSIQYVSPENEEGNGVNVPGGPGSIAGSRTGRIYTTNPKMAMMNGKSYYGMGFRVDPQGCIKWPGKPPGAPEIPGEPPIFPESGGLVSKVRILRNDISAMGYSGISAHVFAGLGRQGSEDAVAIESVDVVGNRIQGCMLNRIGPLDPLLRQFIGWGGIAFSICSDATIRDNVISGNGSDSTEPIVGIFLAVAEDVKIERNRIEQNGGQPGSDISLAAGRRGGIIIGIAIGGLSTYGEKADDRRKVDRPALLVSGNVVDAPNARALKAITIGPTIVIGNRLAGAGRSAFASNVFGSLLVAGFSLSQVRGHVLNPREEIDLVDYALLELLSDVLGGDVVNLISLAVAEDSNLNALRGEPTYSPQRMSGGEMMINDNQISLQRHSAEIPFNLSSVLLISADDISFCDNQAEVENSITFVVTDVLAAGATLRVSSNRLQEKTWPGVFSAITFGIMNQTSFNQSTHCIFAVGHPAWRYVEGNTSIFDILQTCDQIDGFAKEISDKYGKIYGHQQVAVG